jgi:mono/diheme cytochrome c family protein
MTKRYWRQLLIMAAVLLSATVVTFAQQQAAAKKAINRVPISRTSMASGEEMYMAYCAACHGKEGRGNGPAASEFKTAPSNLTILSAKHNGKFPDLEVVSVIQFGPRDAKAHGSKDMPVWGELFNSLGDQAQTKHRIYNLTKYLESLQVTR